MTWRIKHPEFGYFVGFCLGLGFWEATNLGEECPPIDFETEEEARDLLKEMSCSDSCEVIRIDED